MIRFDLPCAARCADDDCSTTVSPRYHSARCQNHDATRRVAQKRAKKDRTAERWRTLLVAPVP